MSAKNKFKKQLESFIESIQEYVSAQDGQWNIKGFIDVFQNVYTISSDTKIISKVFELHLLPKILLFAKNCGYKVLLPKHQNHYPDLSFVKSDNSSIKFAVDFKTTYRYLNKPYMCNGFTLGSHGKYFQDRTSTKNITFPYSTYTGHFCLGVIYSRNKQSSTSESEVHQLKDIQSITSVVKDFQFFVAEKWRIASDKSGSGNTANIGSISHIKDIINEQGMFSKLGEKWFDDYWMNFRKITISNSQGKIKKIDSLKEFVEYRKGDISQITPKK